MASNIVNHISKLYRDEIAKTIHTKRMNVNVVGVIASGDAASIKYAEYTTKAASDCGIKYSLEKIVAEDIEAKINELNLNNEVHGIFIYFPIFGDERDKELKNKVSPQKDIEGLSNYWVSQLERNIRFDESLGIQCILPCTALSSLKVVEAALLQSRNCKDGIVGKIITIFNRSDVVGLPLAKMLFNDGATIYSFDIDGGKVLSRTSNFSASITRAQALAESDVVITGVPSRNFEKIKANEMKETNILVNFSFINNISDEAKAKVQLFIPQIGELTVALCLRNALRIASRYHA